QWKACHVDYGTGDVLDVDGRLDHDRSMRLGDAILHADGHRRVRVADVDLAAGNVGFPAVQRGRPCQPGDRVPGRRVGRGFRPGNVCRQGAVVDDAAAARRLRLHEPERLANAQERTGQIDVNNLSPLLDRQIFKRDGRGADACVVEQEVEPAEGLLRVV